MFYTIYKITNKETNQIYIGQHITDNLDDKYMGSGTRIQNALSKHGRDVFSKEILFVYDNFEDMDRKEAELVNEDFIKRSDTYNIVLGGTGWCTKGTVAVELLTTPGLFTRIPVDQFDKTIHRYPTSGSVQVYLKTAGDKMRVSVEEYRTNKDKYNTASTRRVSVRENSTGLTSSIPTEDFNSAIHEKVFGGIVAVKDGKKQYVTKDEFITKNLSGVHKGKITAYDKVLGITQHITQNEYYAHKDRYLPNGSGTTMVKDRLTGKSFRVLAELVDPRQHIVGTTGWTTVYEIEQQKFVNIPKGTMDTEKYKRANDKKFICYNADGTERFTFWGGKQEFIQKFNCPASVWESAIKGSTFTSDRQKSKDFNGCNFVLIDWKP
jgi:hypothetical protein